MTIRAEDVSSGGPVEAMEFKELLSIKYVADNPSNDEEQAVFGIIKDHKLGESIKSCLDRIDPENSPSAKKRAFDIFTRNLKIFDNRLKKI